MSCLRGATRRCSVDKRKLPRWSDTPAVRQLVNDALLEHERLDAEMQAFRTSGVGFSKNHLWKRIEEDAVEAANRNDYKLLAELLKPANPLIKMLKA